jgi:hypothetical protein
VSSRAPSEYAAALLERRGVTWAAEELRPQQPPAAPPQPPQAPAPPPPMPASHGGDAQTVRVPDLAENADTIPMPNPFDDEAPTLGVRAETRPLVRPRIRRITSGARSSS